MKQKLKTISKERKLIILETLFAVLVVISNVVSPKVLQFSSIILPGSAFTYIFTFFISNIISEDYGSEESKKCVKQGIVAQALATFFFILIRWLPAQDIAMQGAYIVILGKNWVFVTADLIACIISQFTQIIVFNKIRSKLNKTAGNILSMFLSQFLDTFVFLGIAYGIGFGWIFSNKLMLSTMFLCQYVVKILIALALTPTFSLLTSQNEPEGSDNKATCQNCIYLEDLSDGSVCCSRKLESLLPIFNRDNIRPCKKEPDNKEGD